MSNVADAILDIINKKRKWLLHWYVVYQGDYLSGMNETFSTEWSLYDFAMKKIFSGLIKDRLNGFADLTETQRLHLQNWMDDELGRHTIESAQAIFNMANEGVLDRYSARSLHFDVSREKGVFIIATREEQGGYILHAFTNEESRKLIIECAQAAQNATFNWKWVPNSHNEKDIIDGALVYVPSESKPESESKEEHRQSNSAVGTMIVVATGSALTVCKPIA